MRYFIILIACFAFGFQANAQLIAEYNFVATTAAPGDGDYGLNGFFLDTDGYGVTTSDVVVDQTYFFDSSGKKYIIKSKSGSSPFQMGIDAVGHSDAPSTGIGQLTDLTSNGLPFFSGGVSDKLKAVINAEQMKVSDPLFGSGGVTTQQLADTAAAVRDDFPVDTDTQLSEAEVQAFEADATALSSLVDTAAAIRSDFPVDTDTQLSEAEVQAFEADADALSALVDTASAIRSDFPVDTDTQLSEAEVQAFEADATALAALVDSASDIRDDFPVIPADIVLRQELLDSLANVSGSAVTETFVRNNARDSAAVVQQALQDTAAAIRSDFPVDTDTQLSEVEVQGYEADATALSALVDSSAAIRSDFPTDTDTQLSEAEVQAFEADATALSALVDTATAIRGDFPTDTKLSEAEVQAFESDADAISALADSSAAIRSDFPTDTDTQLSEAEVQGFEADATALSALVDTASAIRDDFPVDTDTQLSEAEVQGYEADATALSALIDTASAIRDDFPTAGISGSGTDNYFALWDGTGTIETASMFENFTGVQLPLEKVLSFDSNNASLPTGVRGMLGTITGSLFYATANDVWEQVLMSGTSYSGASDFTGFLLSGELKASGVTAGTYTNATVTVNSKGIITGLSAGSAGTDDQDISGSGFNPSTGDLTIGIEGGNNESFSLDGRYLTSEGQTITQTLSGTDLITSISGGNSQTTDLSSLSGGGGPADLIYSNTYSGSADNTLLSEGSMFSYQGETTKTYFAWMAPAADDRRAWLAEFDHDTKTFSTAYDWGVPRVGAADNHAIPGVVVSPDGHIVLAQEQLNGTGTNDHNSPLHIRKSNNPLDPTAWTAVTGSPFGDNISYTHWNVLQGGRLVHFARRYTSQVKAYISDDSGETWTEHDGTAIGTGTTPAVVSLSSSRWAYQVTKQIKGGVAISIYARIGSGQGYPISYGIFTRDGETYGNWEWWASGGASGFSKDCTVAAITSAELQADCVIAGDPLDLTDGPQNLVNRNIGVDGDIMWCVNAKKATGVSPTDLRFLVYDKDYNLIADNSISDAIAAEFSPTTGIDYYLTIPLDAALGSFQIVTRLQDGRISRFNTYDYCKTVVPVDDLLTTDTGTATQFRPYYNEQLKILAFAWIDSDADLNVMVIDDFDRFRLEDND